MIGLLVRLKERLSYRTTGLLGDLGLLEEATKRIEELERAVSERLSFHDLTQACKNIGYDITCGACAELFFTGVRFHRHDEKCKTVKGEGTIVETTVHISGDSEGFPSLYDRTPEGYVNNCALANGAEQKDCQVCVVCPDRHRFEAKP